MSDQKCSCGKLAVFEDKILRQKEWSMEDGMYKTEVIDTRYRCWNCRRKGITPEKIVTRIIDDDVAKRLDDSAVSAPQCPRVLYPNVWVFSWSDREF